MADLMADGLHDVGAEALGIIAEVAYERVAEDQDLVRDAAASEPAAAAPPVADVQAVCMVLGAVVRDDDRDVLKRVLELARQTIERLANKLLEFRLAVMPVGAHRLAAGPSVADAAYSSRGPYMRHMQDDVSYGLRAMPSRLLLEKSVRALPAAECRLTKGLRTITPTLA